ncbi:MAG: RNA polymerase sigma factor [Chitinophagales bacterium]
MDNSLHVEQMMTTRQSRIIEEAVRTERVRLFRFIRARVNNEEDARDILQDVFFQLASNSGIVESIENMASWLYRVTRNKIIDWYRKRKTDSFDPMIPDDPDMELSGYLARLATLESEKSENPDMLYERNMIWDMLYASLRELPSEQREVFEMHELENKSFQEIAEITGAPVNTLLSRKRYAVLHLRKKLQGMYSEFLNDN